MLTWLVAVFVCGFLVGVVSLAALEGLGVYVLIKRLNRKTHQQQQQQPNSPSHHHLDPRQSLDYAYNKQGFIWVLEPDKVPKNWALEKAPKEQKRKKEVFEVSPVRKYAKIKDRTFILTDSDGSRIVIPLKGCIIEAVSATSLPSRKWAKRFPIKVESKTSVIYNASKTVYIYFETSWEKESWCKALRLASCHDKERLNWFTKLNEEFHFYLTSLNTGYPSFMKPSVGLSAEPTDRASRIDGSASKVRLFWKKLARKASRTGVENRATSFLGREERKSNDRWPPLQDPVLAGGLVKAASTAKAEEDNAAMLSSSTLSQSASQSHLSVVSDVDSEDKFNIDEGTLCWNLLISRLFFDAKSNAEVKSSVKARIQRTLSNMRTPSYIGEVICTDLEQGNLPPYIHGIRVLPTDMNEVWAWEVDIEYCGGVVLDIETRLEVRDLDLQKGIVDADSGSNTVGDVSSDLLEGFEHFGSQLNLSEGTTGEQELKDEGLPKLDGLKNSSISTLTNVSRWKSILNSIAKQVSQVPLSLSIRVASLRGTLRLHIKPPPSDQLWFGFTSMPDIEFELESSVGEHKITSGHIALFLISRFKASICETMVLPNCESICIPWMLAEKNDWVPRNVGPFLWINQEATSDNTVPLEAFGPQHDDAKTKSEARRGTSSDHPESKHQKTKNAAEGTQHQIADSSDAAACLVSSIQPSMQNSKSLPDLKTPLLASGELEETCQHSRGIAERGSPSWSLIHLEKQNHLVEEDDSRPKKMGRRAKMLDLGKKMGEKFEEKRRHIEEKGRNIVEKMRGP